MRASRTQAIGSRTPKNAPISRLDILNKEPGFDYSFRRRKDVEEAGGVDEYGWEPVGVDNHKGEAWALPFPVKTKGRKQLVFQDTILCKREHKFTAYFQRMENKKYNSQKMLITEAAGHAKARLRELDPNVRFEDGVKSSDGFSQRKGPSEESGEN